MVPGHDPEYDDGGLPPVDVVIPDDARELDPDVQTYHREVRQERRRALLRRLSRRVRRFGVIPPISLAILLVVATCGTLVTVLTPNAPRQPSKSPLARPLTARTGQVGGLLPDIRVRTGRRWTPLRVLRPAVLALVPEHCRCADAADTLTRQAGEIGVPVYFVAAGRSASRPDTLASTAAHGAHVIADPKRTLARTYDASGFTAILVRTDGIVRGVVRNVRADMRLEPRLSPLVESPAQMSSAS
ncbi:MAG: hypothetical protein ACRDN9_09480 [Streptosporangiaceae bacterium]